MPNGAGERAARLLLCAILVAGAGCHRKKAAPDSNVVASVNGETLSRTDFEQELTREVDALESDSPPTPEQLEPIKRQLLNRTIERALLLQAARARNIAVSPAEVDRAVLKMRSDYPADGFDEALASGEESLADLKRKEADRLTIEKLFAEHVYSRVAVTEEEIRAYYEANADKFAQPEEVHALQIVVKELDDAKRIQAQLRSGKKFQDLARRYSLSPDGKVGGDLGFFPRGVMPPQFDEVCFKLPAGSTSDIVATEYGFHLFKVLERRPAVKKQLVQVRGEVEQQLLGAKRAQAQAEFLQALKAKADIQINEPVLAAINGRTHDAVEAKEP